MRKRVGKRRREKKRKVRIEEGKEEENILLNKILVPVLYGVYKLLQS